MLKHRCATLVLAVLFISLSLTASAAGALAVGVSQSVIMNIYNVDRVAIANPEIADVVVISGSEVLLVGKSPGSTTLHVWSGAGRDTYQVEVGTNDTSIADSIKKLLGYPGIRVSKVNKTVMLEGTVNDQYQKTRAEKVAGAFGEKVVNLLEITNPKQVKIEAKVIEVSKNKLDNLGIKWGNDPNNPGVFTLGQSATNSIADQKKVFGWFGTYSDLNGQLDALVSKGYANILSQPNVITVSGEKANILVGGEIPIPVAFTNGTITVEWKEYGIKLQIAPEVGADGLIASKIKAEVSSLDYTNAKTMVDIGNNYIIPAIKTRRAETVITLASGQTMAIGGLIASEDAKSVTKLPVLSEVPVLGRFFTSTSTNKDKKEIIIILTPTLISKPNDYASPMTENMKKIVDDNPWKGNDDENKPKDANPGRK